MAHDSFPQLGTIPVLSPEAHWIAQQSPEMTFVVISGDEFEHTILAAKERGMTVVEIWATALEALRTRGLAGLAELLGQRIQ